MCGVERQRRTNRRWAAGFLELLWDQYDGAPTGPEVSPSVNNLPGQYT
ncbi:hypothetical protein AB0H36_37240 [Kribbella sp. NPDC050820]